MDKELKQAKSIWNNGSISVVLRRGGSNPIRLRVPFSNDNREWLKNGRRKKDPVWEDEKKYWELPASRFNEIIKMILNKYGKVYILQPYRAKEVCSPSCINAQGFECQCSCLGANHGSGNHHGWYEVTEALAVKYGDTKLGCRLLESL
ncbi:MAG: hypothetical protein KZQ84_00570 [Candidatus Thiodiazotropha sp. (ex Lucinoma borealis)]|nr:hypothetical protein [Candidatus Thiodiazotropha sp. (ex Lucinoma borealis)]